MLTRKEIRSVIITAIFTLAVLAVLDKFVRTHHIDHSEHEHSSPKFALLAAVRHSSKQDATAGGTVTKEVQPLIKQAVGTVEEQTILPEQNSLRVEAASAPVMPASPSSTTSVVQPQSQPAITCPASVAAAYASAAGNSEEALAWCRAQQERHHVNIGHSWGSLPKEGKLQWDQKNCNELLKVGKLQSCDQRWGWSFFREWLATAVPVVQGVSNITCGRNVRSSVFCQYQHVMLHFGKIHTHADHRSFDEGFLTAVGEMGNFESAPKVPGFHLDQRKVRTGAVNPAAVAADVAALEAQCDIVESRPTFVVSNDDIYNLGHYYNDVMGVWGMLTLAGVSCKTAVLLNMDGLRPGGPAGKQAHRLMVPGNPDEHGPYIGYFNSWFAEVQKTSSFGAKKVCYKELYLPPMPGVAWFWNDWGIVNSCSMQAASPLYQSYNVFMRNHWRAAYGEAALPNPPTEVVHVVIEVRAIDPRKTNNHSKARHISNLAALVESLQALPGVKVTAQDFAKISFEKQVALSHSAGVFISMHGAGTTHIFHAALGQPNCCALIELFPDTTIEFHAAQGYGNLARMLGFHHWRHVAELGSTKADGTRVDVPKITALVAQAVEAVQKKPTCLHSVKDTRQPVSYGKGEIVFSHR